METGMKHTKIILAALLLLSALGVTVAPAQAQIEKVVVRVDGMSCPFCAYGLEKKMKKVKGAENVVININGGTAVLTGKSEPQLSIDALKPAVKDAGFTPREITITVSGTLTANSQGTFLNLPNDSMRFALSGSDDFLAFAKAHSDGAQKTRVVGSLEQLETDKKDKKHSAERYAIAVETFEAVK